MRDMLFRLRHHKSRREVVAFSMGLKVGRELVLIIGPEEAEIVTKRITDELKDDYA